MHQRSIHAVMFKNTRVGPSMSNLLSLAATVYLRILACVCQCLALFCFARMPYISHLVSTANTCGKNEGETPHLLVIDRIFWHGTTSWKGF